VKTGFSHARQLPSFLYQHAKNSNQEKHDIDSFEAVPPPPSSSGSLLERPTTERPQGEAAPDTPIPDEDSYVAGEFLVLSPHLEPAKALAQSLAPERIRLVKRQHLKALCMFVSTCRIPDTLDLHAKIAELKSQCSDHIIDYNSRISEARARTALSGSV